MRTKGLVAVVLALTLSGCGVGFKLKHGASDPAVSFGIEGPGYSATASDPEGNTVFGISGGVNPSALAAWVAKFFVGQWDNLTGSDD